MTEAEWLACDDPGKMLSVVHELASDRRLRLLSVACCRGEDTSSGNYTAELEAVERLADGLLAKAGCDEALGRVHPLVATFIGADRLLEAATSAERWKAACDGASRAGVATSGLNKSLWHYTNPRYSAYIRDIFGYPFRRATFLPSWRTDTVLALARQMYDSRDFGAMPILADALQDADCENQDVLGHCRGQGPHVRGCWVVDLVLGKE